MRFLLCLSLSAYSLAVSAAFSAEAAPADAAIAGAQIAVAERTVTTSVAKPVPTEWKLGFNGLFVPREEVAVGTTLQDQRIAAVEAEAGDYVTAGQVLMRLDTVKLDIKLRETEARVARARAWLAQQEATQAQAQSSLNRTQRLRSNGAVSEQSYDDKLSALNIAEQSVGVAKAEFTQAEAQLAEAKSERARAVIHAPVSGIISERNARAGALAGSGTLFSLIRDGEIEFAAEVPESEILLMKAGQAAHVTLPDGKIAAGHIRLLSPKIDRQTRLGRAYIAIEGKQISLFSGAFGRADVVFSQSKAILVNDSALLHGREASDASVFVVVGGKAVKKTVKLGLRKNGAVEIRSGLSAGDHIIEKAGPLLRDGETVTPVPARAP